MLEAGLNEALRGFESDMLVMSLDWEQSAIPKALQNLSKRLKVRKDWIDHSRVLTKPRIFPILIQWT